MRDNKIALEDPNATEDDAGRNAQPNGEEELAFDLTENEKPCSFGQLFSALSKNTTLRLLDLSYNELSMAFLTLANCQELGRNTALQYLLLNDNRLIVNEASSVTFTAFMANLPQVSHIDF